VTVQAAMTAAQQAELERQAATFGRARDQALADLAAAGVVLGPVAQAAADRRRQAAAASATLARGPVPVDPRPWLPKRLRTRVRCTARSTTTGQPCRAWAIHGGTVCVAHGGRAPQVRAAATRRLQQAAMVSLAHRMAAQAAAHADVQQAAAAVVLAAEYETITGRPLRPRRRPGPASRGRRAILGAWYDAAQATRAQ